MMLGLRHRDRQSGRSRPLDLHVYDARERKRFYGLQAVRLRRLPNGKNQCNDEMHEERSGEGRRQNSVAVTSSKHDRHPRPVNETAPDAVTRPAPTEDQPTLRDTNIVLYQAEWCPYCARVRAKLTDLLLDYKVINVPQSHAQRQNVKAVSGQTSIPVLVDGDVVLDDDDTIVPYLEKTYGRSAA